MEEYKSLPELKERVYKEAFRMFASGFNQGLKAARDAPSAPLADLRAPELDSDGEEVCTERMTILCTRIVIMGEAAKRTQTFEPAIEGKVAKRA